MYKLHKKISHIGELKGTKSNMSPYKTCTNLFTMIIHNNNNHNNTNKRNLKKQCNECYGDLKRRIFNFVNGSVGQPALPRL